VCNNSFSAPARARRSDAGCIEEAIIGAEVEHAGLDLKLVAANEADLPSAVRVINRRPLNLSCKPFANNDEDWTFMSEEGTRLTQPHLPFRHGFC
jgi:hypothetical protein